MVNPSSSSVCYACGSGLTADQPSASARTSEPKRSKSKTSQLPLWLRMILGIFILYSVVVIVDQWRQLPSGSVQSNQAAEAGSMTDPTVADRITRLEKESMSDPKNADLLLELANALHDAKFFPRAIDTYKKYLAVVPKNYDARVDLGICYYEEGNSRQAIQEIESVVKIQPKHQMALFNLGIIHLSGQNVTEAKKWLQKCIEIDPQSTAGLKAQEILQQH